MSQFKGTAGEWRAEGKRVFFGEHPIEMRNVHDARLIAQSKNLLEALQNLENDDESIPEHAWNMVQAAIAKATGVV
jgi:hypothetical protein